MSTVNQSSRMMPASMTYRKKKKHGVWQLKRPDSLPALPWRGDASLSVARNFSES